MNGKIPGYTAQELIGYGASAQVWRGRVNRTGAPVALKRVPLSDPARARAAQAEAALLSALEHPHLLHLHELVVLPDALVLVLDLADGGSLHDLLERRTRIAVGEVVTALAPLAAALAYAHDEGVVHGDVSPANVLFTAAGVPLLADLGVARIVGAQDPAAATLAYLDPCVATGSAPGPPSDVFSIAAVALHALTGQPAWFGADVDELLAQAAEGEVLDLDRRLADVPAAVADIVRRGLDPAPYARGTAAEFALDLRHAASPVPVELLAGRRPPAALIPPVGPAPRHAAPNPAPAAFERPDFRRPDLHGPDVTGLDSGWVRVEPEETPPSSAMPLTHQVRARVREQLPAPRRRWQSPRAIVAALAVVAMVGAGATWWLRHSDQSARAASPATAGPPSAPSPVHSSVPASTAAPEPLPSSSPSVAIPTSGPAPRPSAPSNPATHPRTVAQWSQVLRALDAHRERAFAENDPGQLSLVYPDGSLLSQDRRTLARVVPAGCRAPGLSTTYTDVHLVQTTAHGATLRADAALAGGHVVCAGASTADVPARKASAMTVTLLEQGDGSYRIIGLRVPEG